MVLLLLPLRLWCLLRHKRYWRISPAGWNWACDLDGFDWAFSEDEIRQMMG